MRLISHQICRTRAFRTAFCLAVGSFIAVASILAQVDAAPLTLKTRQRVKTDSGSDKYLAVEKNIQWEAKKTAIVVCDMWARHWCRGATKRVGEMAPRMNEVISQARKQGVLIIHCPSGGMELYKDTPMRKLAQQAPKVKTKIPLQRWCYLDEKTESALPIVDSDGGCDCWPTCDKKSSMDRHQIGVIKIEKGDAITDSGEAYYLMKQRGIENVIVMGVHTNMCVLGRPFSIRQMVYQGQNVVLMRDMTDTMYNSRSKPYVPHTRGTDLVIEHIEKYWCPTIASTDFAGKEPIVFAEVGKPHVVFLIGEREYQTEDTLPVFAKKYLEPRGLRCTFVLADEKDKNHFPGLKALKTADLLFVSVRRRSLPKEQLDLVREYLAAGNPLVGIRTASHAFHTKGKHEPGQDEWQAFDADVLGGNYNGHHGNKEPKFVLKAAPASREHAILSGIDPAGFVGNGSLYKVSPLAKGAQPLLIGSLVNFPAEPVAWTHRFGKSRVFYTSLGHREDFDSPEFNHLLVNAVFWSLNRPVPNAKKTAAALR